MDAPNVFSTYDRRKAADVLQQQHPLVTVYPWITQRSDVMSLIQPHEKGTFFVPGRITPSNGVLPKPSGCPTSCSGNCSGCALNPSLMNGRDGK